MLYIDRRKADKSQGTTLYKLRTTVCILKKRSKKHTVVQFAHNDVSYGTGHWPDIEEYLGSRSGQAARWPGWKNGLDDLIRIR